MADPSETCLALAAFVAVAAVTPLAPAAQPVPLALLPVPRTWQPANRRERRWYERRLRKAAA